MKLFKQISIRNKIIAITLLVTIAAVTIGFIFLVNSEIKLIKQQMAEHYLLNANIVADDLKGPMSFGMSEEYTEVLNSFVKIDAIDYAFLLDTTQSVIATYNTDKKKLKQKFQFAENYYYKERHLIVTVPVVHSNNKLGILITSVAIYELTARIENFIFTALIVFIGIILISFVLSYYFGKLLSEPIIELANFMHSVSRNGNYNLEIEKNTNDEIGDLYEEVNKLLASIVNRDAQKDVILKQLRKSEVKFKYMADLLPQPLFETNKNLKFSFLNHAGNNMLKIESDYSKHSLDTYIEKENRNKIIDALKNLSDSEQVLKKELILETKDSDKIPVIIHAQSIIDRDSNISRGIRGTFIDIRDIKKAQMERERLIDELEAKNAELERFTYTVSHDLKSPLITIKGFLGLLQKDAEKGDMSRMNKDIQRIGNAADKMQNLLEDLLELSRIGRIINPPENIDMNNLIEEVVELLHGKITEKNAQIDVEENLKNAFGDKQRIMEVFQNLIENALKFNKPGKPPVIHIGQQIIENNHYYYVKDTGVGIDTNYHSKIFQLFDKLDNKTEGTGVGLSLVKRIIEVHGGTISVESEKNVGTKFIFSLSDSNENN